jgi:hypothetical protein
MHVSPLQQGSWPSPQDAQATEHVVGGGVGAFVGSLVGGNGVGSFVGGDGVGSDVGGDGVGSGVGGAGVGGPMSITALSTLCV